MHNTRSVLQQQILDTFDEVCLQALQHCITGYASVTPVQMLDYLNCMYGEVSHEDSVALKAQLSSPYDVTSTMYEYFNKLEDIQMLSASGTMPVSEAKLLT